ncbi:hypothetical protein D5018_16405 [Parashewanella curva]|uniref:Uncharacterized protein n=1 Tax=Parashewanella curva TaxID=2338552 RepID=A0A3L8PX29_9GAMM|nr:hypothetical protein [Parashewanella curva]RLV58602.1 hypothetical protein D5018_16405 [Parashewanella curva]
MKQLLLSDSTEKANEAMNQLNELCGPNHNPFSVQQVVGVQESTYAYYFNSEKGRGHSTPIHQLNVPNISDSTTMEGVRRAEWRPVYDFRQLTDLRIQAYQLLEKENKPLRQEQMNTKERKRMSKQSKPVFK